MANQWPLGFKSNTAGLSGAEYSGNNIQYDTTGMTGEALASTERTNAANAALKGRNVGEDDNAFYTTPYAAPDNGGFVYADPNAFTDANQQAIYNLVAGGIDRSSQNAPQAQFQNLGQAATYGGAAAAPYAGSQAAQIAPQMMTSGAQLDTAQDQQFAAAQASIANLLAAQAQGQGPSLAAATADQQREANVAAQMAALGSQRGSSSTATGLRQAQMGAAQAQAQASQQAVTGRAQEALGAQAQLAGVLQGARGQTQSTAATQAQLAQQAALANQQGSNAAALQQAQLAQASGQFNAGAYNQMGMQQQQFAQQAGLANQAAKNQFGLQQGQMDQQTALANLQAGTAQNQLGAQLYQGMTSAAQQQNQTDTSNLVAYQQMVQQAQLGLLGINAGIDVNSANNQLGLMGAGLSAAGSLLASDARLKTGIRSGARDLRGFLDAIVGGGR